MVADWKIADAAAFVAAIDRELDDTARDSVEKLRVGRLTEREKDYVVGLLRDIRSDLAHAFGTVQGCIERPEAAVAWRDKIRWIRQELERRREVYPDQVAKNRITEADARLKLRMLETLDRLYWRHLFMWEPEPGPALDYLIAIRRRKPEEADAIPHGRDRYRELARKHFADAEIEDGATQGNLLVA